MPMIFEKSVGVSEFAQMIRDSGGSMSNEKLFGIAQSGGFIGYRIYIYKGLCGSVEGWISRQEAERWIMAHSVESQSRPDFWEFAQRMEAAL